jgi:hypothetical protein
VNLRQGAAIAFLGQEIKRLLPFQRTRRKWNPYRSSLIYREYKDTHKQGREEYVAIVHAGSRRPVFLMIATVSIASVRVLFRERVRVISCSSVSGVSFELAA